MALSILDGNQSATTLSTILSSGQHITAHTVISLGTQAIADIVNATSANLTNTQLRASAVTVGGTVTIGNSVTIGSLPNVKIQGFNGGAAQYIDIGVTEQGAVGVVLDSALPAGTAQIGSVTANSSNGSLTTRFGSVTTANTAFATSAVTNANRKYLLIQNITTASNAITVGIGFTPTTTQGILLSSGAVITFEGNYIPTGAVNLLSSVTASCFTILEA